jgi:dihydrofolate reductase
VEGEQMKLIVGAFLSLDGVMQAPGGPDEDREGGFDLGGWLVPYADEDMGKFMVESITSTDAFLLGRKTYEIFAAHWPKVTDENDPIATSLNSKAKYVASRRLDQVDWNNSRLLKGDVAEAVAELKRQPGGDLQTQGSGELIQTLIRHDLVDEYRLLVYPVVLGKGKRLFREGNPPAALRLVDTQTTGTGIAIHTYASAGKPEFGSFEVDRDERFWEDS